jgi:NitT/TauT family transport system substrate-binding protein
MKPSLHDSTRRSLTLLVRGCAGLLLAGIAVSASAQVEKPSIKMSQGWLFQATQAEFPLAVDKGYWKSEGLEVTVDSGQGSQASVTRVVSGSHDIGFADTGTLIKYNAEHPEKPLLIFYIPEEGFPLGVFSLKSKGLLKPKDLEGKKLGAPATDGGRQMFPAFAKANGIDESKISWVTMAPNLREQMLVRGDVDGVTGFVTSSVPSINGLGVKTADLNLMMYHQFNLDGFGNAVFATKDFVEKNPRTVTAFVKGLNKSYKEMIVDPAAAMDALKGRDPVVSIPLETQRLSLYLKTMVLTPIVMQNGLGTVDQKKLEREIASVLDAFNIKTPMAVSAIYTEKFLPSKADRMPPPLKD